MLYLRSRTYKSREYKSPQTVADAGNQKQLFTSCSIVTLRGKSENLVPGIRASTRPKLSPSNQPSSLQPLGSRFLLTDSRATPFPGSSGSFGFQEINCSSRRNLLHQQASSSNPSLQSRNGIRLNYRSKSLSQTLHKLPTLI